MLVCVILCQNPMVKMDNHKPPLSRPATVAPAAPAQHSTTAVRSPSLSPKIPSQQTAPKDRSINMPPNMVLAGKVRGPPGKASSVSGSTKSSVPSPSLYRHQNIADALAKNAYQEESDTVKVITT